MRFLALKNIDYYSHRADQGTETSIYVSPPRGILECQDSTNSKCVIIFKDREALKAFSKKLETARGDRALSPATIFEILSQHIIEESVQFLRDISFQIHNAKYTGMKNPTRGVIEYLLLVEDYLREMPELLDSTREWIEGIESVSDEPGTPGNANLARQQAIEGAKIRDENIDYLKVMSQKILQEAKEVKKMVTILLLTDTCITSH